MNQSKTDKEIDEILKDKFFPRIPDCLGHYYLCGVFLNTKYMGTWDKYWHNLTGGDHLASYYMMNEVASVEKLALLRLLIAEDFKKYIREEK
jgi:hypothetical protein